MRNPHRSEARPPSDEWPGRVEESELIICSKTAACAGQLEEVRFTDIEHLEFDL